MQRRARGHEEGWLLSYADLITNLLLFFVIMLTASNMSQGKMQQIQEAMTGKQSPESLESIQKEIDARIASMNLKDVVVTELTEDGLQVSLNSGVVFASGQDGIKPDFDPALKSMLEAVVPYADRYHFAVEGHTDETPVAARGPFASNWELSAARAIRVRERLEASGIARERIRVEGYADTRPLPADKIVGLSDDERRARLRRVVVRIF
jgi:chemotaxis protein MotB